eukprot:CAMPEP_0168737910 /NCGR_PEP_ID=MMETSP0724-20121128/10650_1 /TAXON_ID=265536 /ORGANISM="Amphiprora sp., Strain CCMP467" /LENGTH=77 /DNA_ID=CAMNT_0008785215 /DNA_START=403 /DNA_END=637 /DNA_ORIENTATION=+
MMNRLMLGAYVRQPPDASFELDGPPRRQDTLIGGQEQHDKQHQERKAATKAQLDIKANVAERNQPYSAVGLPAMSRL